MKSMTKPVSHALLTENGRLVAKALAYTALILGLLSGCSSSDEPKSQFAPVSYTHLTLPTKRIV